MGDLVNLQEYREKKEKEEEEKILKEIDELKKKVDFLTQENYIPVFPSNTTEEYEYYHWHPPHIVSYDRCDQEFTWGEPESYDKLMVDSTFDWEKY